MLIPGVGNETARRLLTRFGSPADVLRASHEDLLTCLPQKIAEALQAPPSQQTQDCIARTEAWLGNDDAHLIFLGHPEYLLGHHTLESLY